MTDNLNGLRGLTTAQARQLQEKYGKNELTPSDKKSVFKQIMHTVCEPMFLLLLLAAVIYFILGEPRDGAVMLVFVAAIISIDVIQQWKTDKTLNALKDLSAPRVTVLRDGAQTVIQSADLVPGDVMLLAEGVKVPADGIILRCSDLCVDESSLTGESQGVWKTCRQEQADSSDYWRKDTCYAGTLVTQGTAAVLVSQTGAQTQYGKIGAHIADAPDRPTPLQKQTGKLVKLCAGIAAVLFASVGFITWFNLSGQAEGDRLVQSILSGITLAMAMIPEEFPVILTVFLSMGAWRLARQQSLVRRLPAVETLGAVSVLCVDKTGTITLNRMTVKETWAPDGDLPRLCETMGLGCETEAYDPMEQAMLDHCEHTGITKDHIFSGRMIKEYAFTNEQKMMGHVWEHDSQIIIAAKGSPERILLLCSLNEQQRKTAESKIEEMSLQGLRVIAVGEMNPQSETDIPQELTGCTLTLRGLIGLADPPRESVKDDILMCRKAGVRVVMITGDNGITAGSIAAQVGIGHNDKSITGDELCAMSEEQLREHVKTTNIFSRVLPEHKMRIVKALKENGEIVAMTGDGVNDAPALKYADIGIAMGNRGSEVAREAADLILLDDNFSTIVRTIRDGRRIYDNIRKAVGYIFTIHIPIAFASLLAPFLHIAQADLFLLPLHIVLLELIIDPTCSIVLERQPAEHDIMQRRPRKADETIVTRGILAKSIIQGLVIFAASFGVYYAVLSQGGDGALARTMGLVIIMFSNLFLVQVNSSHRDYAFRSIKRLIKDKVMWAINLGTAAGILLILYTPLCEFLKLSPLSAVQLLAALCIAAAAVFWYELVKLFCNLRTRKK